MGSGEKLILTPIGEVVKWVTVHSVKEHEAGGLHFNPHSITNGLMPITSVSVPVHQRKEGRKGGREGGRKGGKRRKEEKRKKVFGLAELQNHVQF